MSNVVDKECLERNYIFLTNEIDALELLDRLVESKAISLSDRTRIVDTKSNFVRNRVLVNIILNSSSEYVLNSFLKSLETKYKHVLDKLQEQ
ncbi:death domain-containing protein CRADD, partial [Biomphalaria glabrata]